MDAVCAVEVDKRETTAGEIPAVVAEKRQIRQLCVRVCVRAHKERQCLWPCMGAKMNCLICGGCLEATQTDVATLRQTLSHTQTMSTLNADKFKHLCVSNRALSTRVFSEFAVKSQNHKKQHSFSRSSVLLCFCYMSYMLKLQIYSDTGIHLQ